MSNRRAIPKPAKPEQPDSEPPEVVPPDGRVTFEDGDWVQFPLDPTHGQSKVVAKAVMAAAGSDMGTGAIMDCMAPTVAALAIAGKLTDAVTHEALPFPFTAAGLDGISASKLNRLFTLALTLRGLIPNPPRPR